jgi:hypothetical protein
LYQNIVFLVCFLRFSILCKGKLISLQDYKLYCCSVKSRDEDVCKVHMHTPTTSIPTGTHTTYIYLCTPHYYSESVHPLTIADGFACLGGSRMQNNPNGKLAHKTDQPLSLRSRFSHLSVCIYLCIHRWIYMNANVYFLCEAILQSLGCTLI